MSTEPQHDANTIEGHAAELDDDAPGTDVALAPPRRRERTTELIRPFDANQVVETMRAYQELCNRLLTPDDIQNAGGGRTFKKKSAWRKLALAFDLDVTLLVNEVERDDAGQPIRARAVARAISPSGRMQDGDGYCAVTEPRFNGNKQKLENDLRATATTRAKNRAISDLLGTGEVSAEEVEGQQQQSRPRERRQTTARTPAREERTITVAQRRMMFGKAKEAGLDEDALRAIVKDVAGTEHTDRVAKDKFDDVLAAIEAQS